MSGGFFSFSIGSVSKGFFFLGVDSPQLSNRSVSLHGEVFPKIRRLGSSCLIGVPLTLIKSTSFNKSGSTIGCLIEASFRICADARVQIAGSLYFLELPCWLGGGGGGRVGGG